MSENQQEVCLIILIQSYTYDGKNYGLLNIFVVCGRPIKDRRQESQFGVIFKSMKVQLYLTFFLLCTTLFIILSEKRKYSYDKGLKKGNLIRSYVVKRPLFYQI